MTWEAEDAARIVGMYRAGVSIKDIARRFGTTTGAVTQLMRRKGAYRTLTRKVGKPLYAKTTRTVDVGDNISELFGNVERPAEK
jgi:transposase-like protein